MPKRASAHSGEADIVRKFEELGSAMFAVLEDAILKMSSLIVLSDLGETR